MDRGRVGIFIGYKNNTIKQYRTIVKKYKACQNTLIIIIENLSLNLIINSSLESNNNIFEPIIDVP